MLFHFYVWCHIRPEKNVSANSKPHQEHTCKYSVLGLTADIKNFGQRPLERRSPYFDCKKLVQFPYLQIWSH